MLGLCFLCARHLCAQKPAAYILDTAPTPEKPTSPYRVSVSATGKAVTLSYHLRGPHSLNLRAEYFRSASMPKAYELAYQVQADWKYRSVPLTASYTYALPSPTSRLIPIAGFGLSAHFFKQTEKLDRYSGMPFSEAMKTQAPQLDPFYDDAYGLNLGAEISLGLVLNLNDHIFVTTQGRYRYIDCLDHKGGYYGYLSVIDFGVDIGFHF